MACYILGVSTCALPLCRLRYIVRRWELRVRRGRRRRLLLDLWKGLVREDNPQVLFKQILKPPVYHGDLWVGLLCKKKRWWGQSFLLPGVKSWIILPKFFLQYLTENCTVPKDEPDVWDKLCRAFVAQALLCLKLLFHSGKLHSKPVISTYLQY